MSKNATEKDSDSLLKELGQSQQEELIKEEIQRFIKLAKERGALAIEEINERDFYKKIVKLRAKIQR